MKPIVPIAKGLYSVTMREIGLLLPNFRNTQVIETEMSRKLRLIVIREERLRRCNVGPLGESLPPPVIILRDRMKLRKIESDKTCG